MIALKIKNIMMRLCIAILISFMITVFLRIVTSQVLVKQWNVDNAFTRFVFWGNRLEKWQTTYKDIDWQALYPFEREDEDSRLLNSKVNKFINKVDSTEGKIEEFTSDILVGYRQFVEMAKRYERMIGWNISVYSDYNSVIELDDGYLAVFSEKIDVNPLARSVEMLNSYCQQKGVSFIYVQAPSKISENIDSNISGKLDFSNQNADELIKLLTDSGISVLDLREEINNENLNHHELFYKTDNHWKAETGLWATGVLANKIVADYNLEINVDLLNKDKFDYVEYKDWFIGSQGKKITLARTVPENISLIYPKYITNLDYIIPSKEIHANGDFSITYDMTQIMEKDYYNLNPYRAYNHGDSPLTVIKNNRNESRTRVLLIKDSYANCVAPFLALGVKEVEVLDVRNFTGSVEAYIAKSKPDIVVLMYNPSSLKGIDWSTHTSVFDFR